MADLTSLISPLQTGTVSWRGKSPPLQELGLGAKLNTMGERGCSTMRGQGEGRG